MTTIEDVLCKKNYKLYFRNWNEIWIFFVSFNFIFPIKIRSNQKVKFNFENLQIYKKNPKIWSKIYNFI